MNRPFVEVIMPTFNRFNELKMSIASMACQTVRNWKVTVVIDDSPKSDRTKLIGMIGDFDDDRIQYIFSGKQYNDWGHTPREIGKQQSNAHYVIMTGDDNYYTPNFVKELSLAAAKNPGMIYWDMVHSHYGYCYFKCAPHFNQIDMGAFATRTDLAKQIKLGTDFAADGTYVEDFKKKFPTEKIEKINKILFVHN